MFVGNHFVPHGKSKTWESRADSKFWHRQSKDCDPGLSSSTSSTQWRPNLRAERDVSSVAGDISEGSAASPRLGSIDELDEEALRDWRMRLQLENRFDLLLSMIRGQQARQRGT